MFFIQSIFAGWTLYDLVVLSESIFNCAMLFAAVILVGCRDDLLTIQKKVQVKEDSVISAVPAGPQNVF
jgi:hypothetical protein